MTTLKDVSYKVPMNIIMVSFIIWICLFGVISLAFGGNPCPLYCKCSNVTLTAVCMDGKVDNGVIVLPDYVRNLTLTGMHVSFLKKVTSANLEHMVFRHNDLINISEDALSNLKHLKELDLSGNGKMNVSQLEKCISNIKSPNLTIIKMNSCDWQEEPIGIYRVLSKFKITRLTLSRNNFKKLHLNETSKYLPNLVFLSVSYNNIEKIIPGRLPILNELQIHHNYVEIPLNSDLFVNNGVCNFPNLTILNLASNFVNYFEERFFCLDSLEVLTLSRNPVKRIVSNTFINLTSLKTLRLDNLGDRLFQIERFSFKSNSLENLSFANNRFAFTESSVDTYFDVNDTFNGIPNLKSLNLGGNVFNLSDGSIQLLLNKTPNLLELNITSCELRTIPFYIFGNMTKLQKLDLSHNHISSWSGARVFGKLSSLKTLRLSHNYINVFNDTSFPVTLIMNITSINLARNPYFCSCKNFWFRNWIQKMIRTRPNLFERYPEDYICINPPELDGTRLSDYLPSDSDCHPYDTGSLKLICTSLSLVGIFSVVIVSILYKGRWHIRYWIYLYRAKKHGYVSVRSNDSFLYTGFVVYCDQDRHWVHSKFVDVIEVSNGLKLCIHHRDFVVGKLIVDNIADCIAASKKIILVLSKAMVQSDWCLFETKLAQQKFLNRDIDSLIVIMLDSVYKNEMPRSIRDMVNMTTYITWSEESSQQKKFWADVLQAIKEP